MERKKISNLELIDISTENDFLIDSQLCDSSFQGFRLSVAYEKIQDGFEPVLSSSRQKVVNSADIFGKSEEENRQNGECNMRKSLAWDRAFFTDAGVLNPEELSMVNKGFKTEIHLLPGIAEELQSSAESNFTIGRNSFSIDSLEIDLFKDFTDSNLNLTKSLLSSSRRSTGKGVNSKKLDVTPRHMKPRVDSPRQSSNTKGLERNSRERKAISSESNSTSLRTPKLSGRSKLTSALPNKRASFGNAVPDPKKPCLGKSCSSTVTPGSTIKSCSSGSSTITSRPVSCCSYDRSGNISSSSMRRKIDSGKVHNPVFGSQSGVSVSSITNKTRLNNSTYKSRPKMFFCLSPSSSMDHCSLESSSSSSSSSIFNSKSMNSKANMNVTPSKGTLGSHLHMSPVSEDVSSRLTPSGLRFPSPKFGYFDVEKSRELIPEELQFSGQQCNTPESETPLRTAMGSGNKKSILKQKNASQETKTQLKTNEVRKKLHGSSQSGLSNSSKSDEKWSHQKSSVFMRKGVQVKANTPCHIPNFFNAAAKKVHEEDRQRRTENSRHIAYVSGKENLFRKEDEGVDELSKQLGSIDLNGDVAIELV